MVDLGYFPPPKHEHQVWGPSTHTSMATGGSFPKGIVLRLKMSGAIPLLSMLWCVWVCVCMYRQNYLYLVLASTGMLHRRFLFSFLHTYDTSSYMSDGIIAWQADLFTWYSTFTNVTLLEMLVREIPNLIPLKQETISTGIFCLVTRPHYAQVVYIEENHKSN